MGENTKIEWTDTTRSSIKAGFAEGQRISKCFADRHPTRLHPIKYVLIAFGRIAGSASRNDVTRSSAASCLDRRNVIPRVCWLSAIRTHPAEIVHQFFGAIWWNCIHVALSTICVALKSEAKLWIGLIPFAPLTIRAFLATPVLNSGPIRNPLLTRPAPCLTSLLFAISLKPERSCSGTSSAGFAVWVDSAVPMFIATKVAERPPFGAVAAKAEACRPYKQVRHEFAANARCGNAKCSKSASHAKEYTTWL